MKKNVKLNVVVAQEVAKKIKIISKIFLLNVEVYYTLLEMAGEPALDKVVVSFLIPVALHTRLKREASNRKMTLNQFVTYLISEGVEDVELQPEDYEEIANQIRLNNKRRIARRSGAKVKKESKESKKK